MQDEWGNMGALKIILGTIVFALSFFVVLALTHPHPTQSKFEQVKEACERMFPEAPGDCMVRHAAKDADENIKDRDAQVP